MISHEPSPTCTTGRFGKTFPSYHSVYTSHIPLLNCHLQAHITMLSLCPSLGLTLLTPTYVTQVAT